MIQLRGCWFLSYGGPNMIFYSVLRRQLAERVLAFMKTMPVFCRFTIRSCACFICSTENLQTSTPLLCLRYRRWGSRETAQKSDIDFYKAAGLDPAANKLQWLLCGFEGAAMIMNATEFPAYPVPQRQAIADLWFTHMFHRFKRDCADDI